jgi:hypothetical protein
VLLAFLLGMPAAALLDAHPRDLLHRPPTASTVDPAGGEIPAVPDASGTRTGGESRSEPAAPVEAQPRRLPAVNPSTPSTPDGMQGARPDRVGDRSPDDLRAVAIRQRLERLGARYLLLERRPGDPQPEYYFRCDLVPVDHPHRARRFEVTGQTALAVTQQLLAEVEAWCGQDREMAEARP